MGNQNDESEHGDDRKEQRTPGASDKTLEAIDGVLEPLTIGCAHATSLSGRRSAYGQAGAETIGARLSIVKDLTLAQTPHVEIATIGRRVAVLADLAVWLRT